jgi:hypothetical protein
MCVGICAVVSAYWNFISEWRNLGAYKSVWSGFLLFALSLPYFFPLLLLPFFIVHLHQMANSFRIETDTFGDLKVPADRYWGAQTQR